MAFFAASTHNSSTTYVGPFLPRSSIYPTLPLPLLLHWSFAFWSLPQTCSPLRSTTASLLPQLYVLPVLYALPYYSWVTYQVLPFFILYAQLYFSLPPFLKRKFQSDYLPKLGTRKGVFYSLTWHERPKIPGRCIVCNFLNLVTGCTEHWVNV